MRLLITRPQPDADQLAATLRGLGHQPIIAPLFTIIYDDSAALPADSEWAKLGGLIFTSRNGVRALARRRPFARRRQAATTKNLPVFAIGTATAACAQSSGWRIIYAAGGDVAALVALIGEQQQKRDAPLLHIAGRDRAGDVQAALGKYGLQVERAVLYRAQAIANWPPAIMAQLHAAQIDGVVLYSQRAAQQFLRLWGRQWAAMTAPPALPIFYCLSPAIADIVRAAGGHAKVAAQPSEAALLAVLADT